MDGIVEKVFAPALDAAKAAEATAKVEPGVVDASVPSVADANGVTPEEVKTPSMCALAEFVMRHMRVNYDARRRNGIDARLDYCVMAQTCRYDARQKAYLNEIGVPERVYVPITAVKIRAAYAMLMEIGQYGSDVPFSIRPTPDPDVPEEVVLEVVARMQGEIQSVFSALAASGVQELTPEAEEAMRRAVSALSRGFYDQIEGEKEAFAKKRAERLQKKVWDMMVEGGYDRAYQRCLEDFCTYGTTVMVGPVMRNVVRNRSIKDKKSGVRRIRRVVEAVPTYEPLSPVDCYPSSDAEDVADGVLCVRVRYTREELWRFKAGAPNGARASGNGWRGRAVARLLADHEFGVKLDEFPGSAAVDDATHGESTTADTCKFEGIRCFAYVDGRKLLQIGITKSADGRTKIALDGFYYTETIVIGGLVVYCCIHDERVGFPLSKSVFYKVPGSWWGESIADKLYDVQSKANNASISLIRNMGPASSAQLWIRDLTRLVDKSPDAMAAEPGKIWGFTSSQAGLAYGQGDSGVPMGVLQIPSNAAELLRVLEWAVKQADVDSGIPAFAEGVGGSNGGALRTAAGLATFTEHAIRGVKALGAHLDEGVVCGPARLTADWILVNDDDMDLKGDVEVRPVGFMGKIMRAQSDHARAQVLNTVLQSPLLKQIVGVKGIVALFRPMVKDIGANADDVCPSNERMEFLQAVENVRQLLAVEQDGAEQDGAGDAEAVPPQLEPGQPQGEPAPPQGGVAERRSVA